MAPKAVAEQLSEDAAFQKRYFKQLNKDVQDLQAFQEKMETDIKDKPS